MTIIYILGAFSVILAMASGYFSAIDNKPYLRLVTKTVASFLFIVVGLIALLSKGSLETFDMLIMIALVFGMLGDIFLCGNAFEGLKEGKLINLFGVVTFALGHLTFVINFLISAGGFTPWTIALFFVIPLAMVAMVFLKFLNTSKKMIMVLSGYGIILSLMFMSSVNFYLQNPDMKGILVMCAGIIFTSSDTSLLVRDYSKATMLRKPLKFYVLLSYYVAQLLFAISMMF